MGARLGPLLSSRPPTPAGCWLASGRRPRHCPRVAARGLRGALSRGGLEDGAAFCVVPARPGQWGGRCRAGCWGMARRCVLCFSRPPTPEGCWLATRHRPRHCPRVAARGLRGALSRGGLGMARRCVLWCARPPALDGLRARGAAAGVMIFMLGHHALGQAFARGETTEGGERDLLQLGVRHGDVRLGQDRSDAFQLLPV